MPMLPKSFFYLCCIILLFSSCVSFTGIQTAKTLGKNNTSIGLFFGFVPDQDVLATNALDSLIDIGYNYGFSMSHGIMDNLDIYARIGLQNTNYGLKYRLNNLSNQKFALAVGLDHQLNFPDSYLGIPFYMSFHPSPSISVYSIVSPYLQLNNVMDQSVYSLMNGISYQHQNLVLSVELVNVNEFGSNPFDYHQFNLGFSYLINP